MLTINLTGSTHLDDVGDDDLEAANDHSLGGGHPAHGLRHQDAPHYPEDSLEENLY